MIKLDQISEYLGSLDNTQGNWNESCHQEVVTFMEEFRGVVQHDFSSPNIIPDVAALDLAKPQSITRKPVYFLSIPRIVVAASLMLAILLILGASRREFVLKERRQLIPIDSRLLELTHSVEDDFDSIKEIESLLTDLDSNQAAFTENIVYWKTIRIGLSSMLAIEQAKRGKFQEAQKISQEAVREAEQFPSETSHQIPIHSLTHFASAKAIFDMARREKGERRHDLLMLALLKCDEALAWTQQESTKMREKYGTASWKVYSLRILALRAAILHKSSRIDEAHSIYDSVSSELFAFPESQRDSSWHNLTCRVCADWGLTLLALDQPEKAIKTYQTGLNYSKLLPTNQSLWLAGLLRSNLADTYAVLNQTQLEIETRNDAIDALTDTKRVLGTSYSIDENLILNHTRLACAFLRDFRFPEAIATTHRLHALAPLSSNHIICASSDKAKIALLLSSDLSLSPSDRAEFQDVANQFMSQIKPEQMNWSEEKIKSDNGVWLKLLPLLPNLSPENESKLEALGLR